MGVRGSWMVDSQHVTLEPELLELVKHQTIQSMLGLTDGMQQDTPMRALGDNVFEQDFSQTK